MEVNGLSPVGFGAYRIGTHNPRHRRALERAVDLGCNHVDTAPHYMGGESERLIGSVLEGGTGDNVFVVTKVGYVDDPQALTSCTLGPRPEDVVVEEGRAKYVMNVGFFQGQLDRSCTRLRRDRVDGLLLHNPEHFLEGTTSNPLTFLDRVGEVFEWCESRVRAGQICWYGISSNRFRVDSISENPLGLERLAAIAAAVTPDHRFRLVQLPYNLLEAGATSPADDGLSLIDRAHKLGLVVFANRPLNAMTAEGPVRLATYDAAQWGGPRTDDAVRAFVVEFEEELRRQGHEGTADDFPVVRYLSEGAWRELGTPESVEDVFQSCVFPLVSALTGGDTGRPVWSATTRLAHASEACARGALTRRAAPIRERALETGLLDEDDRRPFATALCESYLRAGLDHVLIGMRRPQYVEELRSLF